MRSSILTPAEIAMLEGRDDSSSESLADTPVSVKCVAAHLQQALQLLPVHATEAACCRRSTSLPGLCASLV